jgi:preprotein translocase subunit SecA
MQRKDAKTKMTQQEEKKTIKKLLIKMVEDILDMDRANKTILERAKESDQLVELTVKEVKTLILETIKRKAKSESVEQRSGYFNETERLIYLETLDEIIDEELEK